MEEKTFKYLGATFRPLRRFTASEDFVRVSRRLGSLPRPYCTIFHDRWGKYNYKKFYAAAGGHSKVTFDVFVLVDCNLAVIPCGHQLFTYEGEEVPHE